MTIFILVNFFRSMPGEMFEAACIDGCSIFRCFFEIALPLSKTGLFVTGLMTFINNWNELLMAMVFISDANRKTLSVSLTYFVGPYSTNYTQMFAAIVIAIAPSIIVYSCFSNQIVEGLTTGAIKGWKKRLIGIHIFKFCRSTSFNNFKHADKCRKTAKTTAMSNFRNGKFVVH